MPKLIIIEGLDGCGKSTQTELLENFFKDSNVDYKKIKLRLRQPVKHSRKNVSRR